MSVVLRANNTLRLARFTGVFAGILIALYITLEAPISGTSMNPARSFGSNVFAMAWSTYWIYALGPCAGMVGAAALFRATGGRARCAKMVHDSGPCTFRSCEY
jgi:aquaporin Z